MYTKTDRRNDERNEHRSCTHAARINAGAPQILPPPTNVVVLPDGIHKPPEPKAVEASQTTPAAVATVAHSSPASPTMAPIYADVGFRRTLWDVQPSSSPAPAGDRADGGAPGEGAGGGGKDVSLAIGGGEGPTATMGKAFGSVSGSTYFQSTRSLLHSPKAKEAEAPKEKSTDTGAYKNKDGAFKDVMDLLDSDEVKTFKKLRWGGAPVKAFLGLVVVSNQNDKDWKAFVDLLNRRFNLIFVILLVISVGCILGVQDLAGLPNPPVPVIGLPDATPPPAIA